MFICCCFFPSVERRRPVIKLNSRLVGSTEVVIKTGNILDLRCEGNEPVNWQPRLAKHKRYVSRGSGNVRTFKVDRATAEFTGTYKCFYAAKSQYSNLTSWVHVYVKGE